MSLRYALLALLTARPLTGYELSKQFGASVGYVWHAPDSQIYPELRRMELDGMVEAHEEPSGNRRVRRLYRITETGVQEFRTWMNTPVAHQRGRDVHRLRTAYLEWATPDAARLEMDRHVAFYEAELAQWSERRNELSEKRHATLAARLADAPEDEHERIVAFKVFAYEGLMDRARMEIEWARRGLALIDDLSGPRSEPGSTWARAGRTSRDEDDDRADEDARGRAAGRW